MIANIQVRSKGTFTLPSELRRKYGVNEGDFFTIIDMGDSNFLLKPYRSRVDELADTIRMELEARGETLESMLTTLREVREEYAVKSKNS